MANLMEWIRQYVPARGFPAEAPNGAEVAYNAWDNVSWWFNAPQGDVLNAVDSITPSQLYKSQPHLRTVVSFMGRNVGQLGLPVFERVDDSDRRSARDSTLAKLLARPNPGTTRYELINGTVADLALYEKCYWWISKDIDSPSGWAIVRVPVPWVTPHDENPWGFRTYTASFPGAKPITIQADNMLVFHGWSPDSLSAGVSPVEALKDLLLEQIEGVIYRKAVWKRGGKVSAVITRPAGHKWSDEARKQFSEAWRAKFTGSGSQVGGTPILEDGMTLNKVDFSAREQEFIEGTKLSLNTVASVYHINPTMIGLLDNANYSNVREFRKMLYGDTLGPVISMIEDRINTFLLPMLDMDTDRYYAEFNIQEKLQGNFEEQSSVMSSMVGAPIMTPNEGRARFNLPAIEGGDHLVVPLNVTEGGQASPTDSGSQNEDPLAEQPDQAPKAVPPAFLKRQRQSALARKSAGWQMWWDAERWDRELAQDMGISKEEAHALNEQTRKELEA